MTTVKRILFEAVYVHLLSMFTQLILSIHNLMLSQVLDWCSSYKTMVLTVWLCLTVFVYLVFLTLFKTLWPQNEDDVLPALCKAIEKKDIVTCLMLLEKHPQYINSFMKNGYTPFLIACANANTQLVKVMLKKGADVMLKSKNGESAFYLAAFYYIRYPDCTNATCIRELYYAGADINETNNKQVAPLQMAAMFGHTALVKWLLGKNATLQIFPDPYLIAKSQGHQETACLISRFRSFCLTYKEM